MHAFEDELLPIFETAAEYDRLRAEIRERAFRDLQTMTFTTAAGFGDLPRIEAVLRSGLPVDTPRFGHGATAMMWAVSHGEDMVRLLLDHGADVNVEDCEAIAPFHHAVGGRRKEIVKLLLDHGADPRYRTQWGTPLDVASLRGTPEIVDLLRSAGAENTSPRDEAIQGGFPSFAPLFEAHDDFPSPAYVELEHFGISGDWTRRRRTAFALMRSAIARSGDGVDSEIAALLAHYNWRPQLIGAVAVLLGAARTDLSAEIWAAIGSGSYVSGQLAATAFYCDPEFERRARFRIEAACPIRYDRVADRDWFRRGAAARPNLSRRSHSHRALTALVELCRALPDANAWLDDCLAAPLVRATMDADEENGFGASWLERALAAMEEAP